MKKALFLVALLVLGCSHPPMPTIPQDQTRKVRELENAVRREREQRGMLAREVDGQRILIQQLQRDVGDLQRKK